MSKISEKKAKDIANKLEASQAYKFDNFSVVCGAIEGYDQALKDIQDQAEKSVIEKSNGEVTIEDLVAYNQGFKTGRELSKQEFLEKAERWIEKHIEMFSWVHCDSDGNEEWKNDFKNYMQDEM